MSRRFARVLLLIGGLLYANWVVQLILPVHLSMVTSYVSELSALSNPYHQVFRSLDILSGTMVMAGGLWGLCVRRRDHAAATAFAAIMLFGVSNILDALTPLPCTLTVGAACNVSAPHDVWGWVGDPHVYASLGEEVFFALGLVAVVVAGRSAEGAVRARGWPGVLGAAAIAASVTAGLLTADLNFLGHDMLLGLAQRVEVLLMAVWVALAPGELLVADRRPAPSDPPRDMSGVGTPAHPHA